jgi:hypothetical protein
MTVCRLEQHCLKLYALKAQQVTRATFPYQKVIYIAYSCQAEHFVLFFLTYSKMDMLFKAMAETHKTRE